MDNSLVNVTVTCYSVFLEQQYSVTTTVYDMDQDNNINGFTLMAVL